MTISTDTAPTSGPWIAREGTTSGMEVVGKKPRGGDYIVARCGGKDRIANARLIAAALDLLEACEAVFDADDMTDADRFLALEKVAAAIAAARGREG